jgi:hypothetical protein
MPTVHGLQGHASQADPTRELVLSADRPADNPDRNRTRLRLHLAGPSDRSYRIGEFYGAGSSEGAVRGSRAMPTGAASRADFHGGAQSRCPIRRARILGKKLHPVGPRLTSSSRVGRIDKLLDGRIILERRNVRETHFTFRNTWRRNANNSFVRRVRAHCSLPQRESRSGNSILNSCRIRPTRFRTRLATCGEWPERN